MGSCQKACRKKNIPTCILFPSDYKRERVKNFAIIPSPLIKFYIMVCFVGPLGICGITIYAGLNGDKMQKTS